MNAFDHPWGRCAVNYRLLVPEPWNVRTPLQLTRTIEVVEYDPAWEMAFTQEVGKLLKVFGESLIAIHHIGSTSIPGLSAKPVIDMLVVLRETETIDRFSAAMRGLGYRVRGECLDAEIPGTPGRFYFTKDDPERRTHHVHVYAVDHPEIVDKLAFRDYLRTHPQRAAQYGAIKRHLAVEHRHDNIGYMRGKDAYIKSVLDEARHWLSRAPSGAYSSGS